MKRPPLFHRVVGHPLVLLATMLATAYVGYRWWQGEINHNGPLVMVVVILFVGHSQQIVSDYQHKLREWQAITGQQLSGTITWAQLRSMMLGPALLLWFGGIYLCYLWWNRADMKLAVWAFVAGSVLGVINLLWRARRKRPAKPKQWKDIPVTQCLSASVRSPAVSQCVNELPANCAALFGSSARSTR